MAADGPGEALGDLQQICDLCRAGLVLIDLGSYMSALMGACLRRVLAGTAPWGNLFSRKMRRCTRLRDLCAATTTLRL